MASTEPIGPLAGRTAIITGASRGIGRAIAIRLSAEGANVAMIARTQEPHPKFAGTLHTAAAEAEAAGGAVLPIVADVRDDVSMADAVEQTVKRFGGIDFVINNAAVISPDRTEQVSMRQYDWMHDINLRGTLLLTKLCLPELRRSAQQGRNPHVLNISPPINLSPQWLGRHLEYAVTKYGISMATIGLAHEYARYGIAVNSLWPRTTIDTAAIRNVLGGAESVAASRSPFVVAEAAVHLLDQRAEPRNSGRLLLDEDVLTASGVTDLDPYRAVPGDGELDLDLFIDA
ncbi:SDR family oxidoreductase [Nocardia amamiensis]|uniref:SDR family oxidoreductase n=1 Tax=Nocardia TaxID=1817 RepID=UPI0033FD9D61